MRMPLLLLLGLVAGGVSYAEVYRWTDDELARSIIPIVLRRALKRKKSCIAGGPDFYGSGEPDSEEEDGGNRVRRLPSSTPQ